MNTRVNLIVVDDYDDEQLVNVLYSQLVKQFFQPNDHT